MLHPKVNANIPAPLPDLGFLILGFSYGWNLTGQGFAGNISPTRVPVTKATGRMPCSNPA
jgi:hypothetical protein